jgi:hypothetical protein
MEFKCGSVIGTGAIIRVEVGFKPDYVKLFNITDGKAPTMEFIKGMTADYAFKTTNDGYQALATSNGITLYDGHAPGDVLTGTMTLTDGATTLAGSGTSFLVELKVGDRIRIGDQEVEVASITNATTATIKDNADGTETAANGYHMTGRKAGFLIGADSDMNAASDSILWMAMKDRG